MAEFSFLFGYQSQSLPFSQLSDSYKLRFQIEFNFWDTEQYWGLEDLMNVEQKPVTIATNLSLFVVSLMTEKHETIRIDEPADENEIPD